jgi:hypothetical protein
MPLRNSISTRLLAATAVLALGAGAVAVAQTPAASGAPAASAAERTHTHRSHIEGRIAFLKAELKITDQQAAAFNRVAEAMRASDREMQAAREEMRKAREAARQDPNAPRPSAIERMESRQKFMTQAAARTGRTLEAWKPLYAQLSDEQKQLADGLLGRGGFGGRHGHGHGRHHHGRA